MEYHTVQTEELHWYCTTMKRIKTAPNIRKLCKVYTNAEKSINNVAILEVNILKLVT